MDDPGTIFCLFPQDDHADEIVCDKANHKRKRVDPNDPSKRFLRIGINQPSAFPGNLVQFGQFPHSNDVILGEGWSKDDQCYFDFHPTTQELLLHDISSRSNTKLWDNKTPDLLGKSPRICIVPLTREWNFTIGCANFRLVPSISRSRGEIDAFSRPLVPENYERTFEDPLERVLRKNILQSAASISTHSTRVRPRRLPKRGEDIKWLHDKLLGTGGQGDVYKVVNVNTGEHYACKVVKFRGPIPQWKIETEAQLKKRIRHEVEMVEKASHDHIVLYVHIQGWEIGQSIQIFMPVYEGNLQTLIKQLRLQGKEAARTQTERMFYQMLLVLDHVHASGIIHRDIKPENILFQGNDFFLTDFGVAKPINTAETMVGMEYYMAPELRMNGRQTPKVDIYALGATYLECLQEFESVEERRKKYPLWQQWHRNLQKIAKQHDIRVESMLADSADRRPTARELLRAFAQPAHALQNSRNSVAPRSFEVSSSPLTSQVSETTTIYSATPSAMDWTRTRATASFRGNPKPPRDGSTQLPQPNLAAVQSPKVPLNRPAQLSSGRKRSVKSKKSIDKRHKRGRKRDGSAQSMRYTPSQSIATPKRTSSRRQRSRSKSRLKSSAI